MRLTVETGPLAGTTVPLDRDIPTLLGSGDQCSLRIREAGVLEQHAVVKALKGEGFGIKANGPVRVNGADVQASRLQDGDVIEIGTTRLAYGDVQDQSMPTIAGYRMIDVLGKGGMGTVYRAEQTSLHRQVALKVLNSAQTQDAAFVSQFVAEARAAAKLQHPNVVSVFDVEHDGDLYYYAMELMHDGSCEDWLKQNGVMPVDRAMQVVADAAAGLAYAESLGIVHRDIKPDNLMLDQHGAIKIADLGLASTSSDQQEDRAIGTPHFMAPEQVLKQPLDHRTDLYALGCTFYRLVTGKTPFRGQTVKDILRAQVKEPAEPANKANSDVPQEVAAIIQRLMAKDPGDRYQTANELLEELEALLQPPQKRGLWIGLAAAAVVVAGGAIYWAVTKPKEKEIITEKVVYDDPEKQQFADRIQVLEAQAREKDATIALLEVQVGDAEDEQLAVALDGVASAHVGTGAADRATRLAADIRRDVARREQLLQQRRAKIAEHVAKLRSGTVTPLDANDYELALRGLDVEPPKDLAGDDELAAGVAKLRDEILDKARQRLQELRDPVVAARAGDDEQALATALEALRQGLQPDQRWPRQVGDELAASKQEIEAGDAALAALKTARRAGVWQSYDELLRADRVRSALAAFDFAGVGSALQAFAADLEQAEAAERARALQGWAAHADLFAKVLEQHCSNGELELVLGDESLRVLQWDREQRQLLTKTTGRRPRDRSFDYGSLLVEQWQELCAQVDGAPAGSRECFLAFVALDAHARAASTYLARVQKGSDDSGTGEDGYPFRAVVFDTLLSDLPESSEAWAPVLRDELQAGKRLAAGLRTLSERRNLAAAGHIEKLISDHPHSFVAVVVQ
ncbi:MAG: protein kinase domain-containing protein [Planctomycetota bacterium]